MRKVLGFIIVLLLVGYAVLHAVVASSPIQRKVLAEIQKALATQGIEISIESIDVSAFAPRIYLNRVVARTNPKAEVQLEHPLEIDKIKLEFQPLGLLGREIVLDEVALLHPKIIVPHADDLYKKVVKVLDEKKRFEVKGEGWPLIFKKVGIVDSQFEVASSKPSFSVRSRGLTLFVSQTAAGQQTIVAQSNHLELIRDKLELVLTQLDADVDFTEQSVRANRLIVEGPGIKLRWKGACALPEGNQNKLDSFHLSHETELDLSILNSVAELKLPPVLGILKGSGTLHVGKETYSGSGSISLNQAALDGNGLGNWSFLYALNQKALELSQVKGEISGGTVESSDLLISFQDNFPIRGELSVRAIELNELLASLKVPDAPIFLKADGRVKVAGRLQKPIAVNVEPEVRLSHLLVLNKAELGKTKENTIISIPEGSLKGTVSLGGNETSIKGKVQILGGNLALSGNVGANKTVVEFQGADLSLTKLGHIAGLQFGGVSQLRGELSIQDKEADVEGELEIAEAEIADLKLGSVRGKVQYRENLLSFSKLELRAIEAARGQGFVDFSPKETQYRFDIDAPRVSIEQVLKIFEKNPLPVEKPEGGELAARVRIEGGKDSNGIDVSVDGQARSFQWYGEKWMSAGFGLKYRPNSLHVTRGVFLKRSGSLEVRATYDQKVKQLVFYSSGLRLEDLNHLGQAPIQGEITGRVVFEGELSYPRGNGELRLSKGQFREKEFPDCKINLKTTGPESEYWLVFEGEKLKAHLLRKEVEQSVQSDLKIDFIKTDFAPYLSAWLQKDISPLSGLVATGSWNMRGDFSRPETLKGDAELKSVKIDFEGKSLVADEAIDIKVSGGGVEVPRFRLGGADSEVTGDFNLVPGQSVKANLNGKVDLEFLQPFIPGLDFGSGEVGLNLRASGSVSSYDVFGTLSVSDASFRITGMQDDFRSASGQFSLSADKATVERFQATLGGGDVVVGGEIGISRFKTFSPNLSLFVSKVEINTKDFLKTKVTGDLKLKGEKTPYHLSGNLKIDEATLSKLQVAQNSSGPGSSPVLTFDVQADAKDQLYIKTDVLDAEFKGNFRLLGDTNKVGLLGKTEALKGYAIFKDTQFDLITGEARFETPERIYPRFNVNGRTVVREQRGRVYQDYEVNLQVVGAPDDYKIRLTSNPPLVEQDLISLLVLGVTTKGQEGNYFDLGTAIMGQTPFKSKIQSQLGFDIKVQSAPGQGPTVVDSSNSTPQGAGTQGMVPAVRIEKGITKRTKLSYSNTLDQNQSRELRLEQMLDENITLNATAGDRSRNNTTARPGDSFGLDVRYRFSFE
jgi:translocation and assembly module TamB